MQHSGSSTRGFIAVILSAVLFGLMPVFAKIVYGSGGNAITLVFLRFALSILPALIYLRVKRIPVKVEKRQLRDIVVISIAGYGSTAFLLFTSYQYIPSGMSTTIHFVYPALVIAGGILFFHEKPGALRICCMLLCLTGIGLFFDGNSGGSMMGILIAFASGVTYSFYILALDKTSVKMVPAVKMIFYMHLISSIFILIVSPYLGGITWNMAPSGWLAAAALSIVISFGAVQLFQCGVHIIGPSNTALLSTFEPLTSLVVGSLMFGERFTVRSAVGCGLILVSVVLLALRPGEHAAKKTGPVSDA